MNSIEFQILRNQQIIMYALVVMLDPQKSKVDYTIDVLQSLCNCAIETKELIETQTSTD